MGFSMRTIRIYYAPTALPRRLPMHERTIAWLETLLFLAVIVIVWLAVPM